MYKWKEILSKEEYQFYSRNFFKISSVSIMTISSFLVEYISNSS